MKRFLVIIVIAALVLAPCVGLCAAASVLFPLSSAADYVILEENIDITVNEDNSYRITKSVTADFTDAAGITHGITESVVLRPRMIRVQDGEWAENYADAYVTDVTANVPVSAERTSGDKMLLRLGDAHKAVEGVQRYEYSYTYHMPADTLSGADEFYYDFVSPDNSIPIENITFRIAMPEPFDQSRIGFQTGAEGSSTYDEARLRYTVDGTVISGEIGGLYPYEGAGVRIELREGYYAPAPMFAPSMLPYLIIGAAVFALIILLRIFAGKRPDEVETVEFGAPDGLSSADVGYIADGFADDRDIVSLLLYWADAGLIHITEKKKGDMLFVKVRDLSPDAEGAQQVLFAEMFKKSNAISLSDMRYEFASTVGASKSQLKQKFATGKTAVYQKRSMIFYYLAMFLSPLPLSLLFARAAGIWEMDAAAVAFAFVLSYIGGLVGAFVVMPSFFRKGTVKKGVFALKFAVGGLIAFGLSILLYGLYGAVAGPLSFIAGAEIFLAWIVGSNIPRRTEYGAAMHGKIAGFRRFIETAEKDKLEMLVDRDPSYFYHVLPYAYVLGVSKKWASRFEGIALSPPNWYYGATSADLFTAAAFSRTMNHGLSRTLSAMTATKSSGGSSGGSGFGGGGFTGGGAGGGSFGRW